MRCSKDNYRDHRYPYERCYEASEKSRFTLNQEEAKTFIADKGYDAQFGARPLHRAIQKYLEDPLAEEILT